MFASLICSALLAGSPETGPPPDAATTYREAEAKAGRDADAHVRLALWCEARGMTAERIKHLAMAITADPANAVARGLMGLVDDGGKWRRPEDVAARLHEDEAKTASLAEYRAIRDKTPPTAEAQWKLSVWCDAHGLKPQAEAHARAVTRIDPSRKSPWERLGYKRVKGQWRTEAEIAANRREAEAQKKADRAWGPKLARLRDDLRSSARREAARIALSGVTDPRAVPSIVRLFSTSDPGDQQVMVQLLGQIDGGPASRFLAAAALYGDSPEVRRSATETLVRRDPRDFVTIVIGQIRDVLKYEIKPVDGPGSPGVLMVEGKQSIVRRRYAPPSLPDATRELIAQRESGLVTGIQGAGFQNAVIDPAIQPNLNPYSAIGQAILRRDRTIAQNIAETERGAISAEMQMERDAAEIDRQNAAAKQLNGRAVGLLNHTTGQDLGTDRDAWSKWWTDQQGYAYVSPPVSRSKPVFDQNVPLNYVPQFAQNQTHHSCFAAGTAVRTSDGLRPIETLKVGDVVLTQDVTDGRLCFEPITAVYHNPPASTFEVRTEDDAIVATGIHRFWRAGAGWTMARDLKPGDVIRTVGGTIRVKGVEPRTTQPVFNLEVAHNRSFFVGGRGALVHDNSLVETTPEPFDAMTK